MASDVSTAALKNSPNLCLNTVVFNPFHPMAHTPVTKILRHTKNVFLAKLTKKKKGVIFDSFALDSYCCMAVVIFLVDTQEESHPNVWALQVNDEESFLDLHF